MSPKLLVDRPDGMGALDNMQDRPIRDNSWRDYSITADVDDDARTLNLGLMAFGNATAWWDNVRCEVMGDTATATGELETMGAEDDPAYGRQGQATLR